MQAYFFCFFRPKKHFLSRWVIEDIPRIGGIAMTNEQKNTIRKMREKLCSYAEISGVLGLSVSSIKSYCLRNELNTETLMSNVKRCKNCGKPLVEVSKTKPRVFCCDACKLTWWKKHKTNHKSPLIVEHTCLTCGKGFTAYKSSKRKYCSEQCYQRRNCNG